MTGASALWQAELLKLSTRGSARAALLVLLSLGALGPVWLSMMQNSGVVYNGGDLGAQMDLCAANGVRWAFLVRGFYVAQALWLLLAAQSVGAELQSHTLREELIRPVRRSSVLLAKWAALSTWSLLSVVGGLALGGLVGLILLPNQGQATWLAIVQGAFGAWVSDVCFLAFALAVSTTTRSVAGGVVAALLFLLFERMIGVGLWLTSTFLRSLSPELRPTLPPWLSFLMDSSPWLPSSAWSAWREWLDGATTITWSSWLALLAWTLLACLFAARSFDRTDVP